MPVNSQSQPSAQDFGRAIQPVNIWLNGQTVQANTLAARIVTDNLLNTAVFYYQLLSVVESQTTQLADGNLTMDGQAYQDWGQTGDANQEAYAWIASQLNLILA